MEWPYDGPIYPGLIISLLQIGILVV